MLVLISIRKLWSQKKKKTLRTFAIRKNLLDNPSAELLLYCTRSEWLMAMYSLLIVGYHPLQLISSSKHTIPTTL